MIRNFTYKPFDLYLRLVIRNRPLNTIHFLTLMIQAKYLKHRNSCKNEKFIDIIFCITCTVSIKCNVIGTGTMVCLVPLKEQKSSLKIFKQSIRAREVVVEKYPISKLTGNPLASN